MYSMLQTGYVKYKVIYKLKDPHCKFCTESSSCRMSQYYVKIFVVVIIDKLKVC